MLAMVRLWLAWFASSWEDVSRQIWCLLAGLFPAQGSSSVANLPWSGKRLDRA
jgi:hypothetical protein